ncbi:hypothetical protein U9M48_043513 [Paspalum notatum var. saurae]|uniref:Myb/SANT-like domain-containing protein n=1 Tax=Paspalum notatum var. saurae TaxID=547442 RepID=A0AAQ3UXC8_PASNO
MDGGRAGWDDKTTKIFLDLCIDEKNKFNCTNKGLTRQGWHNVYRLFRQQTGRTYDKKQLQNKFNSLKKTYRLWRTLKGKSGPGWDNTTGTITETPEWWAKWIAENSEYKQFLNRGLQHEDDLDTLFGSMISKEGTMLCVGGVGDRTPFSSVHPRLQRYSPFFYGCIGAIDGTHIPVSVMEHVHDDFINRKGFTS